LTNEKEKAVGMTAEKREELIVSTLPLIKHIAHKVMMRLPATIEMHDLVNAGVLGLLDAVDKFEPERGVKFKTYAEVRIRGTILDSLRDLDWAPRSLRKKSKDLERVYAELGQKLGRPATDEEASAALGGNLGEFHALVDQLHGLTVGSFESGGEPDEKGEDKINYYPDDGTNDPYVRFETNELTSILGEAIDSLPERERLVLSLYYYEEFTMKEIGTLLGVNESRVSQIHTKATIRLRTKLIRLGSNLDRAAEMTSQ
jgi:RNA polymerase sigma factor for flagellar operon FliA